MKTFQILSFFGFWSLSIMACSEKKDDVVIVPATPITAVIPPVTNVPEPEKTLFFNDPVMKKANLNSVTFANEKTIFAFGNGAARGYLFKSVDLGKTWVDVKYSELNPAMNTVEFYDEKVGILGGASILGTKDGGITWETLPRLSSAINRVSYSKNQFGFLVKLIFDNFHARKYTELYSVNTSNLTTDKDYVTLDGYTNDVYFLKNKIGILVGNLGNVYVVTVKSDGTFDYSDRLRPVDKDLLSVFLISEKMAFAGGKDGTFLKTTDGGENWTTVKTSITGSIKKLVFQNENLGYGIVIETEGKTSLYKIEESGQKWTKLLTPDGAVLIDLKINAQGKAVAVGNEGGVYLFP
jgi:photosystem II stability/assembly factor-like uncharacterized protein